MKNQTITLYPDTTSLSLDGGVPKEETVDTITDELFLFSGLIIKDTVKVGVLYLFALENIARKNGIVKFKKPVNIRDVWDVLVVTYSEDNQREYIDRLLKKIIKIPNVVLECSINYVLSSIIPPPESQ